MVVEVSCSVNLLFSASFSFPFHPPFLAVHYFVSPYIGCAWWLGPPGTVGKMSMLSLSNPGLLDEGVALALFPIGLVEPCSPAILLQEGQEMCSCPAIWRNPVLGGRNEREVVV